MAMDRRIFEMKLSEEDVRKAGEGKHEDARVNSVVQAAIKVRQKIVDLIHDRAIVKNSFEQNKAKDRLDNSIVELEENQVPSSDGIVEVSKVGKQMSM